MSQPRTSRKGKGTSFRAEATRSAILDHSARLFATKGFDGTSYSDIAESLDLSRPAVYRYFASKDEILAALVTETSGFGAEKMTAIRRDHSITSTAKLRAMTARVVRDRIDAPERFKMLERSEDSLPEPIGSKHRKARRAVLAEVVAILDEGIATGEFRASDTRITALSVLGMCNWVALWYRPSNEATADNIAGCLADNAVAMVVSHEHREAQEPGITGAFASVRRELDRLEKSLPKPPSC